MPKRFLTVVGCLLVLLIGRVDWITGPEISFSIFYLFPVGLVAWWGGRRSGAFLSLVSAIAWLVADLTSGRVYSHHVILYWNSVVRLSMFAVVALLAARLRQALDHERDLSRTDSLTGAANSRFFRELADVEIQRAQRYGRPLTVAYLDLDNFKSVNDTLGHAAGDTVLCAVAGTVQESIRSIDVAARLGGDEFTLRLPETDAESARRFFARLQPELLNVMERGRWPVTFSIGVVTFPTPPVSVDELISRADNLMYRVKHSSKNAVEFEVVSPERDVRQQCDEDGKEE